MRRSFSLDLLLAATLAVLGALASLLGLEIPVLRGILGLLLVLILPGYGLLCALFPERSLRPAEQILLVGALSVICDALAGLILYETHVGLNADTWALALSGITVVFCLVAGLRRPTTATGSLPVFRLNLSWGQALAMALAVLLTAGAVELARMPASLPSKIQGYTTLWMLPGANDDPNTFRVGLISNELTATKYALQVTANGHVGFEWKDIQLAPGARWEASGILSESPNSTRVEASLYRLDQNPKTAYRHVWLYTGP